MENWHDIGYLLDGDDKQREVYTALKASMVMRLLYAFDATLAGTYPIGIYIPGSDIDIICSYNRKEHFENVLLINSDLMYRHWDHWVDNYSHILVEHHILEEKDEHFRREVVKLKEKGLSTEEAFCFLLGIEGDPYDNLLKFE